MGSIPRVHYEAVNHGRAVVVPLYFPEKDAVLDLTLFPDQVFPIETDEQRDQFGQFPNVEIREIDNMIEIESLRLKRKKK